jgi:hypothetical protein
MIARTLHARTSGLLIAIRTAKIMNIRLRRNEYVFGVFSQIKALCVGFCVAPILTSCVHGNQVPHPNDPPTYGAQYPEEVQATAPARFIVTFNQSVPFSSSSFLLEMQSRTQARFSYLGSVSSAAHVYEIQPLPGQTANQVLQSLTRLPVVQGVEVDQKMKIHQ